MSVPASRGFTLIEILVVLLLVGLMVSMVTLSMGGHNAGTLVQQATERWQARLQLLHDEAIMRSAVLGIKFRHDGGIEVMRYDPNAAAPGSEEDSDGPKGAWVALNDDGVLKNWQSQPAIHGSLQLDGLDQGESLIPEDALAQQDDNNSNDRDKKAKRLTPHLFFLPSGEVLPFRLCLYRVYDRARQNGPDGDTQVLAGGNPNDYAARCIKGMASGQLNIDDTEAAPWSDGAVSW
ncbi:type II secretion system minor pseudopilin GspH [Gallaecimonas sp. GXIMD1310]|uniref:type II secretion system minor pseudopilin GspH n=1 Tax=Gallaecimonas sp. GXIMD1310 TaxID=3131926 RepID=UPI003248094E